MIRAFILAQLLLAPVDTGNFTISVSAPTVRDSGIVRVIPIPVTRIISDIGGKCPLFMFSDSSIVLRSFQKTDSMCVRKFSMIPAPYRKSMGYVQQRTDLICLVVERGGACDATTIQNLFSPLSTGWPSCSPYVSACGTPTTVMDFDREHADVYDYVLSGWITHPLNQFPPRYETVDYWLFFIRGQ